MRCTPSVQPLPDTVLFIIVYWLLAHLPCTKRHRPQELRCSETHEYSTGTYKGPRNQQTQR